MKTVKIFIVATLAIVFCTTANLRSRDLSKNSSKTETIKVSGNCGMCKTRIEKAAQTEGVEKAVWNSKTQVLSVTYDPAITNPGLIGKKVALAGHDNERGKADAKTYGTLPACCKYR